MKKLIVAGIAAAAFCGGAPAIAADMPVKGPVYKAAPIFDWSGFYFGDHIGAAWSHIGVTDLDEVPGTQYSNKSTGFFGGSQFGFNVQSGQVVWGAEVDLGAMGLGKTAIEPAPPPTLLSTIKSGIYGDVTGRLGYAWDRTLLYAKGGYAFYAGGIKNTDNDPGEIVTFGKSGHSGWTVGGGIEQMINSAWSWKLEYQYFDFGTVRTVNPVDGDRYDNKFSVQTIKVGLNYKLGDWGKAPVSAKY
jgi:outer membrane immunogenic protein